MIVINKDVSTPLYMQIKKMLKDDIAKGKYLPNERIPPEIGLARMLNVSRMTVNKVINELVREGLLYRHQGKGTYIALRKIDQWFFTITSFSRDMLSRGLVPSTSVLEKMVLKTPRNVQIALKLSPKARVIFIKRLRYANNEPIMLESRYLNYKLCKRILKEPLDKESIHDLLIQKYGLPLTKVSQYLETIQISKDDAEYLGVKPGEPGFRLCRTTFTGESPVTFVDYIYRGDKYRFSAEFVPIEGKTA
jgi:GntR family transcriptional regulator